MVISALTPRSVPHSFDDVLTRLRNESTNTKDLGSRFEALMKQVFENDSVYRNRFDKVWMWDEWARQNKIRASLGKKQDLGIDLVAREHIGGDLCAIQCKCYNDNTVLDSDPVNSFIAAGTAYKMKNYILVCTGPINSEAMVKLRGVKCNILQKIDLADRFDWSQYPKRVAPLNPKKLRGYQESAMNDVVAGFQKHSRGKMIMACGTGKTLVSLHVAEKMVGKGGLVLYLVPSISLILQSMREWSDNANIPHYYMAVCSDRSVRNTEQGTLTELEAPASTDTSALLERIKKGEKNGKASMSVIFSTYHSIEVVCDAMKGRKFDLIFCDEAHRTAGVEALGTDGFYTKVHKDSNVKAAKRLYMTATPRIYSSNVKGRAQEKDKKVISMDDPDFGPTFHNLTFYDAVHKYGVLCDFKVRVAVMDGDTMDRLIQKAQAGDENSVPLDEKTLMASVWHAIQYPGLGEERDLLQRVIMFCDLINSSKIVAGEEINYKADVRENSESFEKIVEIDRQRSFENLVRHIKDVTKDSGSAGVEVSHVDGADNAQYRRARLDWIKSSSDNPDKCRILSNARCLSEGVDVPALDGVVFMNPRKSVVDVVQAVGRVMRKHPGKEYGYVILPVAIPAGMSIDEALSGNKYFKVVWQVLNALRSHDPNLETEINRLTLTESHTDNDITNRIIIRHAYGHDIREYKALEKKMIDGISTEMIQKVGDINYYDKYGQEIGSKSHALEEQIKNKIDSSDKIKKEIESFHDSLKKMINDSITFKSTIQVISQHIVLSQVFDALFQGEFTSHNPISQEFSKVTKKLNMEKELSSLKGLYDDVKIELEGITTREARQNFIKKIYGNFFESADKKGTEQHGVVYTPVELIDFIINSVQYVLKKHFHTEFEDRSVKVLEPFAGTGTFLTRLLESGLITENLYEKYKHDLYANELILLAYYIATVNIETTYSSLRRGGKYVPFDGISYTDTLRINAQYREDERHRHEKSTLDGTFKIAHERIRHQRSSHVHVIMGNPPYSVGQNDYNDQNQNISYRELDARIKITYAEKTKSSAKNALFDSYVRSLRWASDRIGESGIVAFVTNASFIRSETAAGIRACLAEEFSEVWCFDLRGNQRTQGETSKKEGGKIFGSGSRAPVSITILIKNPKKKNCIIHYKDIGDYHTREKKLEIIKNIKSIQGIKDWQEIKPDRHHDWLDQRDDEFSKYAVIGSKDVKSGKRGHVVFKTYSMGIATSRDEWAYNSFEKELSKNMKLHIDYCSKYGPKQPKNIDSKQGKWTGELSYRLEKSKSVFNKNKIRLALYRPFFKQFLYYDKTFNHRLAQIPKFFPESHSKNLTILISYKFAGKFSVLVTDITPDIQVMFNGQYFPLYIYENGKDKKINITDFILQEYQSHYKDHNITKKDIFYYVYGLFHHFGYKKKFANSLSRELPRIPMAPDFWKFNKVGEELINLHLNFDSCKRYKLGKPKHAFENFTKLSFGTKNIKLDGSDKKVADKTKLRIDGMELYDNIPEITYSVNGRTPTEWIIDRYKITTDKDSGITNDPCTGTDIIAVIERAIHVGVESDRIISQLPKEFEPKDWTPAKTELDAYLDTGNFQSKS